MTLSDRKVLNLLQKAFECGWTDITGKPYAGSSGVHKPEFRAVTTTNCAGHHNVQMFFMTPDGRVVHCLPGYWSPEAFLKEAKLALDLVRVHTHPRLSIVEKNRKFLNLQLEHALEHDIRTRRDSSLPFFDQFELLRGDTDFKRERGFVQGGLKQADQVVHERMAERPFLPFERFDVATYVHMGKKAFDSHSDGCRGQHSVGTSACPAITMQPGKLPRPVRISQPARPARLGRPVKPAAMPKPVITPRPVLPKPVLLKPVLVKPAPAGVLK